MIGLDTNVLVRYLAQDDAEQSALDTRLIEQDLSASRPGFISLVVLVELCWVLKRLYAATDAELLATVTDVLDAAAFRVEQRGVVQAALAQLAQSTTGKAGFADALIAALASHHGCTQTVTFDRGAAKAVGMTLLAKA